MKRYAMILMNPLFLPEKHTALFQTGNIENHILTVRNEEEALRKTKELLDEGFGVLEVCGAFERELVEKNAEHRSGKGLYWLRSLPAGRRTGNRTVLAVINKDKIHIESEKRNE